MTWAHMAKGMLVALALGLLVPLVLIGVGVIEVPRLDDGRHDPCNVMHHGAAGDGVTDDTTAIVQTILDCLRAGGGELRGFRGAHRIVGLNGWGRGDGVPTLSGNRGATLPTVPGHSTDAAASGEAHPTVEGPGARSGGEARATVADPAP